MLKQLILSGLLLSSSAMALDTTDIQPSMDVVNQVSSTLALLDICEETTDAFDHHEAQVILEYFYSELTDLVKDDNMYPHLYNFHMSKLFELSNDKDYSSSFVAECHNLHDLLMFGEE